MIYYICKILNLYRIIFSPSLSESSWLALYTFGQLSPSPWVVNINIVTIMVTMVVTIMVTTMMTMMVMIIYMTMIMTKESVQVVVFSFLTFITNEVLVHILIDIVHIFSLRNFSHFLIVTFFTCSHWDIFHICSLRHWDIVHILSDIMGRQFYLGQTCDLDGVWVFVQCYCSTRSPAIIFTPCK